MTDRYIGLQVTFDGPIRSNDAERLIDLIQLVVGVARVEPIKMDTCAELVAERRVKDELYKKMLEVLR